MMIKNINEFNGSVDIKSDIINIKLLTKYATAIEMICDGEYGYTYFDPETNYIAVCLGDVSPFNDDTLEQWFEETIVIDYKNIDSVKIEIDREWVAYTAAEFKVLSNWIKSVL